MTPSVSNQGNTFLSDSHQGKQEVLKPTIPVIYLTPCGGVISRKSRFEKPFCLAQLVSPQDITEL